MATRNQKKKKELQEILSDLDVQVITLEEIEKEVPEIEEDGTTFEANAVKKASITAALTGYICLADDSGLVVDALDGKPGVYSARFAGEGATDEQNNRKLLQLLKGIPEERRTARFVCVIAICTPEGETFTVRGECEGRIAFYPRGEKGFGYDPLFIPCGYQVTFAELSGEEKSRISHRGKALLQAVPIIKELISRDG
ncbi:XTP/dITP diphosphohydrolase [Thermosyntropha lipolytica DSM 11003]|uniref:dITP/XTP pyrophosphatase n=1 Tax=Thermosyntropha lipolytica DSM 11003 TaxID=1123382 RepID=A0A1M5MT67_9FIRM|nr:XTP/dITP diphosphohydrolase [Thermosyntropha lipolytica DSM 11003]